MNDIAERCRIAREKLAQALELLQQPEAGNLIETVAEPVARSMAALHGIEETAGGALAKNAPLAVVCVRQAFGELQSAPLSRASVEAIYFIATSLRIVFQLSEEVRSSPGTAKVRTPMALDSTRVSSRPPARIQERALIESEPAPPAPSGGFDATMPLKQVSTPAKPHSFDRTQPSIRPPGDSIPAKLSPGITSKMPPPPEGGMPTDAVQLEVSLGAHSANNFYKGLGGNDIVSDGGLFVATYEIPPLHAQLWLSVHMPGGYEFQALAQVRWSRAESVGEASAGFGCTFQLVSPEARKLIQRYARNREPLFYDE